MLKLGIALLCVSSTALAGSVRGTVLFEGEAPAQPVLQRDSDPKCSSGRADEAIVVTKGKLRDVVVRIKNGEIAAGVAGNSPPPIVIDQKDCMYTPRVVAISMNDTVVVHNSDNTFHNVHGILMGHDVFNKPQGPGAANVSVELSAAKPGDVLALQCDIHPWMKAYISVNDDRSFTSVTGADGAFDIEGLPEGKYTLEAWHPTLGLKTLSIVIGKGKRADVTARFSYKAREMK